MSSPSGRSKETKPRGHFAELLKVEARLARRQPVGLGMGLGLPIVLLLVFGFIGQAQPGSVANTGLTIIDLWVPTIMVIGFVSLGVYSLPYVPCSIRSSIPPLHIRP